MTIITTIITTITTTTTTTTTTTIIDMTHMKIVFWKFFSHQRTTFSTIAKKQNGWSYFIRMVTKMVWKVESRVNRKMNSTALDEADFIKSSAESAYEWMRMIL